MPLYAFLCSACRKRVEVFARTVSSPLSPVCDGCGGQELRRAVSAFAFHRSDGDLYGDMGKFLDSDVDENDPEAMAHWARGMKEQLGDDADPELDELIRESSGGLDDEDGGNFETADAGIDDDF